MQSNLSNKLFIGYILQSASVSSNFISFLIYLSETASYGYGSPNIYLFRDYNVKGSVNTWYHMKWECIDGDLKYYVYDMNDNLLLSKTVALPSAYSNINVYPSFIRYSTEGQINRFRNILVKSL